jgi:ribosome maturation factor RimP
MSNKRRVRKFRCDPCNSKSRNRNDFCIPEDCCPDRREQPQFSSPTSCLPERALLKIEEEIEKANQLLLDLGLEKDREIREVLEKAFKKVEGLHVEVVLNTKKSITGTVYQAGFDFVILCKNHKEFLLPYENVKSIKKKVSYSKRRNEISLSKIDPCCRRDLTFHFGRTVAESPELIQVFFGLKLPIYLLKKLCEKVEISLLDGKCLKGEIIHASKDTVTVMCEKERKDVSVNHVLWIKML